MLSRSAAERDIYIFVVQKILQNYNFSPGQELSMTITKKKKVKEKRLTPNSSCGILEKKRGLRGKRRVNIQGWARNSYIKFKPSIQFY